jgi:hypothetical protein
MGNRTHHTTRKRKAEGQEKAEGAEEVVMTVSPQ